MMLSECVFEIVTYSIKQQQQWLAFHYSVCVRVVLTLFNMATTTGSIASIPARYPHVREPLVVRAML